MLSLDNLHEYQKNIIARAKGLDGVGLFLEMGLGKSVIALSLIRHLERPTLIIAPKAVAENTWTTEHKKWKELQDMDIELISGTVSQRLSILKSPSKIKVIGVDNIPWLINTGYFPFKCVVIDESSRFKDPSTKRFKALKKVIRNVERRIIMSGTPTPQGIQDLWSQVAILDFGARLGRTLTEFRSTYLDADKIDPYKRIVYKWKAKPGAEIAIQNKIKDICFSMKSEDYLTLPKATEINHEIQWTNKKTYDKMVKDQVVEIGDEVLTASTASVLTNKLLQITGGHSFNEDGESIELQKDKLNYLTELIEFNSQPTIIFHHYKKSKEYIQNLIPGIVTEISPNIISQWQEGKIQYLLLHPQSSGIGLNLQNNTGHFANIIWYDLPWSSENYLQSNARILRQGQETPVNIHHLQMENSIDQKVLQVLQGKISLQEALMKELKI